MLPKLTLILFIAGVLLIAAAEAFFHPRVSLGSKGVGVKMKKIAFFIPSEIPIKVYTFNPNPSDLQDEITKIISESSNGEFGVVVKNLTTGQQVEINSENEFKSASLYKLAVMYTIFKKGYQGKLDLNKPDVKNNLRSMITVSSNEASIYLVENYTSWKEITEDMRLLGLDSTNLTKTPTTSSPKDVAKLLELIATGEAINTEASIGMLDLLFGQKRTDRIPTLLPGEVPVAHKTGELEDVRHDAGIVYSKDNDYILVLMSSGSKNPESVKPVMSKISQKVYEYFLKQWESPPEIL